MDEYLGNFHFIKFIQENPENSNSLLVSKGIESVIEIVSTRTIPGTHGFKGEFYQRLIETLPEKRKREALSTLFNETNITIILKLN